MCKVKNSQTRQKALKIEINAATIIPPPTTSPPSNTRFHEKWKTRASLSCGSQHEIWIKSVGCRETLQRPTLSPDTHTDIWEWATRVRLMPPGCIVFSALIPMICMFYIESNRQNKCWNERKKTDNHIDGCILKHCAPVCCELENGTSNGHTAKVKKKLSSIQWNCVKVKKLIWIKERVEWLEKNRHSRL